MMLSIFSCPYLLAISFLVKCLLKSFAHFLNWNAFFLNSLTLFCIQPVVHLFIILTVFLFIHLFLYIDIQLFQYHLLKLSFLTQLTLYLCQKSNRFFIWALSWILFNYLSIFILILHFFDYYSFEIRLEIIMLVFQICFSFLFFLWLFKILYISL